MEAVICNVCGKTLPANKFSKSKLKKWRKRQRQGKPRAIGCIECTRSNVLKPKVEVDVSRLIVDEQNGAKIDVVAKAAAASHRTSNTEDQEFRAKSAMSALPMKVSITHRAYQCDDCG